MMRGWPQRWCSVFSALPREGGVGGVVVDGGVGRPRGRSASEDGRNGRKGDTIANARARVDAGAGRGGVSTPVTLQPSCVRARLRKGKRDWNPAAAGGVAAGRGLAKAVGGAAAHRGGSDGRDVVGGGCMPLLVRAPATNDHPWSIHGGFIRQVRPTSCCCYYCRYCVVVPPPVASASMALTGTCLF